MTDHGAVHGGINPIPLNLRHLLGLLAALLVSAGCGAPADYRTEADEVAYELIEAKQKKALGRTEPFTIDRPAETLRRRLLGEQALPVAAPLSAGADRVEPIEYMPEEGPGRVPGPIPVAPWESGETVTLSLTEALQVGARNSREYQAQKEAVFRAALELDLQIDAFRNTYAGLLDALLSTDLTTGEAIGGVGSSGKGSVVRRFESGAQLASSIMLDVVKLLTGGRRGSLGIFIDTTITIPLLRGSSRHIVTEPMQQAERNLVYAIWDFERFKRTFVVDVVGQYYGVLQAQDRVTNAAENYRNQIANTRRVRALASEDRLRQEDFDQARQAELSARNAWVQTIQDQETTLDKYKLVLGLPADARVQTDRTELERLRTEAGKRMPVPEEQEEAIRPADDPIELKPPLREGAGRHELDEHEAVKMALHHRVDMNKQLGQVVDAQRRIRVAADALGADLSLVGYGAMGESRTLASADADNAKLFPDRGYYSANLLLDLPFERTRERNDYRNAWIGLEEAVRKAQALEDLIKLEVRQRLRNLLQQRENYATQLRAERVARRRVERTRAFLDLGRPGVSVRDVNEAQADLLRARNAVTAALISYRVSELALQRDLGRLEVNEQGLFEEHDPDADE